MALALTAVTPDTIAHDGGHRLTLAGTFAVGHRFRVHIGPTGTIADDACHSGVPGQGSVCYSRVEAELVVYSPAVPAYSGQHILVHDLDTAETKLLSHGLDVVPANYYLTAFAVRSVLPPHWKTGPRSLDRLPPV